MVKLVVCDAVGNDKSYVVHSSDLITILPILEDFELDYMVYYITMGNE